jgi:hypothetical protein
MRRRLNLLPGIAFHLLISSLLALACEGIAAAGTATLEWAPANTTAYSAGGVVSCGVSKKIDIRVAYTGSNCGGTIGSNPYRFEFYLYRNGVQIGHIPFQQGSSCWWNGIFYSVDADAGTYSARVNFQKRTLVGWVPVWDNSSTFGASKSAATPAFTINGQLATTTTSPNVTLNISQSIIIDATPTTCETKYWLGAMESDTNTNGGSGLRGTRRIILIYSSWRRPTAIRPIISGQICRDTARRYSAEIYRRAFKDIIESIYAHRSRRGYAQARFCALTPEIIGAVAEVRAWYGEPLSNPTFEASAILLEPRLLS